MSSDLHASGLRVAGEDFNTAEHTGIVSELGGAGGNGSFQCRIGSIGYVAVPIAAWRTRPVLHNDGLLRLAGRTYVLCKGAEPPRDAIPPALQSLTGRELQIAHKIGAGKSDKIMAYELGISEYTVREHVRRIFSKLQVSKRASLVRLLYSRTIEGKAHVSGTQSSTKKQA